MGMNPEIKAEWVSALRSGDYAQGAGVLHRQIKNGPDEFCCLGVLCEISVAHGVIDREDPMEGCNRFQYVTRYGDTNEHYLPRAVGDWAGLDDLNPFLVHDETRDSLANFNDNPNEDDDGLTFEEIADMIDEQL
jgi:hypothetical protein